VLRVTEKGFTVVKRNTTVNHFIENPSSRPGSAKIPSR